MKRHFGLILFAAALTAAGCGTAHAPATAPGHSPAPASTRGLTPEQRAEADADSILRSFVLPPGARQLQTAPLVNRGVFKNAVETIADPDLVDRGAWFTAPGAPADVLAWEKQHISHAFTPQGYGTFGGQPEPILIDMYSLPAVDGVLDFRQLLVEVERDGDGTAIRIDAQVTWIPVRSASERVPAGAKAVTIALQLRSDQGTPAKTATITDPAKVRKLVALVNGLPLSSPGLRSCVELTDASLALTFRTSPQGPPLAVATAGLSGCVNVDFTIGVKYQPRLQGAIGPQVLLIAALPWTIPNG